MALAVCLGRSRSRLLLLAPLLAWTLPGVAAAPGAAAGLPDAPGAQVASPARQTPQPAAAGLQHNLLGIPMGPSYPAEARKWDPLINSTQHAPPLTRRDTLSYAFREQVRPLVLVPAFVAAGYGQLADANPHYGTDEGGFGERLGIAALRQASDRLTGDGLLAALFHQDPRFYRQGQGPVKQRVFDSVRQTFVRKTGTEERERINSSGILGHAFGSFLTLAYYPQSSANAGDAAKGFATAVAGDVQSKVLLEFLPDLLNLSLRRNRQADQQQ
jgi:hypothetical protein